MLLYASARGAPTPALNALATITLVITLLTLALAYLVYRRFAGGDGRRRRRGLEGSVVVDGEVRLESLVKRFGDVVAVDGIDVHMPPGEFFTMVGPSGCGKTTTLRMIAGFERPTSGRILLDGVDVAQTPPHRRNVNTVFQSYALFPHLNVGRQRRLRAQVQAGRPRRSAGARSAEMLELVQLGGYENRKPGQLSGGQQQRVALARALILRPRVLLLDEPLGALDARLRKDLQVELKALQHELGVTFVFVTHDQEEALTMSDRVAVMNEGRVEQAGPPQEIYEEPATLFVADFLGVSNLIGAEASGRDGRRVRAPRRRPHAACASRATSVRAATVKAMIRPERVRVERQGTTARTASRAWSSTSSSSAASASCTCASSAATSSRRSCRTTERRCRSSRARP